MVDFRAGGTNLMAVELADNGRATIREVHTLLRDVDQRLTERMEGLRVTVDGALSDMARANAALSLSQATINGSVEARLKALELEEQRSWLKHTMLGAGTGLTGMSGVLGVLTFIGKLHWGS